VQAFEALQREGKIRHWGVSNLDPELMQSLWETPGGAAAQTDQVLYNLGRRGLEWDLRPWLRERRVTLSLSYRVCSTSAWANENRPDSISTTKEAAAAASSRSRTSSSGWSTTNASTVSSKSRPITAAEAKHCSASPADARRPARARPAAAAGSSPWR
jgi:aryl-alcohol dehydrogenase-like predicted oxidoreductase